MTWHGLAEAFAPPPLSEQTYSAVQRVLDMRQIPDADVTGLSALASGRWVTIRCDHMISGRRCGTYLGEVLCYGSAQVVGRCRRPSCKDRRSILFIGGVPSEAELPILDYASPLSSA